MTDVDVHVERATMGVSLMYQDCRDLVRMAYDPRRISEPQALALLYVHIPRLVGASLRIRRTTP